MRKKRDKLSSAILTLAFQMSEVTEQIAVHASPLDPIHERLNATIIEESGWRLPAHYGDSAAEYEVVRGGGAGLSDLSSRGRIEVAGSEAVQFLNGLVTNDVKALEENGWMRAAFPNPQGRLIGEARVLRIASDRFLFDTEAASHERVLKTLERFTLAGDFRVRDLTHETALITIQGASAERIVQSALGEDAARTARGRVHSAQLNGQPLYVIRATHTMEDGFDLFVAASGANVLWDALSKAGGRAVGADALEVLRIEAGIPRYGVDMDETNVVLEAALDDAVSFTKGCYTGQEIIARIHWRGHVAKKLTGLVLDAPGEVRRDDKVRATDGKEIGRITSAVFSPRLNQAVALGYVKYDYLAPGTEVRVMANEAGIPARVRELPLVRGSWFEPTGDATEASH